jgi:hypothetical protein
MPRHESTDCHRPAMLLVHGAWHGPWCWEDLIPVLSDRGWRVHTVELPSSLEPRDRRGRTGTGAGSV